MRLHRLEVSAFGPFAGTERVDFDGLADAGLFLLHGPTGAGKTTLLDAVCFALFGRAPGARGGGVRLRSDHAPPGAAPQVVCEFSVGERRLEITRSPEWQRPKRRGTGTTREPARALLRERHGDAWTALTNRADEVGDVVQRLLGLGVDQFTKLVLLPQGDFAAFLRANAEDRRRMLQRLFGTERFDDVERWLSEHRRELAKDVRAVEEQTAHLAARAVEAAAALDGADDAADGDDAADAGDAVAAGSLAGESPEAAAAAVAALAARAETVREAAAVAARAAADLRADASAALARAREVAVRRERRSALEAELVTLAATADEQARRRERLAAAAGAEVLAPLVTRLTQARSQHDDALGRLAAARSAAGGAEDDVPALETRVAGLRGELGALADAVAAERQHAVLVADHGRQTAALAAAAAGRDAGVAELARLADRAAALATERSAAALEAATLPGRERDVDRAKQVAAAVLDRDRLTAEVEQLADAERLAVDEHQAALDHSLDLRERRLAGMAAELAEGLLDDDPCPVCGATDHPAPAGWEGDRVTEIAEREARSAAQRAEQKRRRAEAATGAAREQLAAAEALAGQVHAAAAAEDLRAAAEGLAAARAAADRLPELDARVAATAEAQAAAQERHDDAAAAVVAAAENVAALAARRDELADRVTAARGEDATVGARYRRLQADAEVIDALLAARRAADEAGNAVAAAFASLERAAAGAGFADPGSALAAALTPAERDRLRAEADAHDAALARVRALLGELAGVTGPGAAGAADGDADAVPEPGPVALAAAERDAVQAEERAAGRLVLATRAAESLRLLARTLAHHATTTAPLRERYAVLDAVSRCAEGTGGDNVLRMRLSAYVLAARLEAVAAVASRHLLRMSGGRYTLVHTDDVVRGTGRSGLGLAVVDGWTGDQRDTASLSGGETFYTSLALALGLADVVRAEAGGAAVDTLLVDEGFGSLDPDTLEEVMDTLDGLRSGGRAVGLVSHVGDLQDRIPARLEVVKTRAGSSLRQPALAG